MRDVLTALNYLIFHTLCIFNKNFQRIYFFTQLIQISCQIKVDNVTAIYCPDDSQKTG